MSRDAANPPVSQPGLKGRELVVAVCGGIAAYKAADVVSKLVQLGAGVSVIMSADAQRFVAPLTFQALSGRAVRTDTFDSADPTDVQHIALTERADLMLVAPATGNILAKVACGICDELVSLVISASACPVVFAPSMNNRMWANPVTQENCAKLTRLGYRFIGPDSGWLACRNVGAGRLADTQQIVEQISQMLTEPVRSAPPAVPATKPSGA